MEFDKKKNTKNHKKIKIKINKYKVAQKSSNANQLPSGVQCNLSCRQQQQKAIGNSSA